MKSYFVPEDCTHLYHTSCYSQMNNQQRLKYNQLFGLRINEQFIQFEDVFIKGLMSRLKRHQKLKNQPQLLADINRVLKDEEQHTRMFASFNSHIRPDLYAHSNSHFTRLSPLENSILNTFLKTPGLLPGLLWLMLAMEEMTTAISREFISQADGYNLDPAYIALHQHHFDDEIHHVGIDKKIIAMVLEHSSMAARKLNALLFRKTFTSILEPKRSTVKVILQLVKEEPELQPLQQTMIDEIKALTPEQAFPANLVQSDKLTVLHQLSMQYPDFRLPSLNQVAQPGKL